MKAPSKIFLAAIAIGLLNTGVFCPQAQAAMINGDIDFGVGTIAFDTNSLATATRVKKWTNAQVTMTSGDFSSVALYSPVTLATPWIFTPSTPTNPLWSVGGFSFNLASSVVVTQNAYFLNVSGIGTISGNGFDPTPGLWSFTTTNANGKPKSSFTFTTDSSAVPTSDGGATIALLGLALTGLEGARRISARHQSKA
jgi:VPDSG-CTERM motif